jgi:hypothetical protein
VRLLTEKSSSSAAEPASFGSARFWRAGLQPGLKFQQRDRLTAAEKSKFCHSEARFSPRNLSFPALKPKRDSSLRLE